MEFGRIILIKMRKILRIQKINLLLSFQGCPSPWGLCKTTVSGQVEREVTHLRAREGETSMASANIHFIIFPSFS